jgi:hypothetical protein
MKGLTMITQKFPEFEAAFKAAVEEYNQLGKEFDSWRGKSISEEDKLKINELISKIQATYEALYPAISFIIQNSGMCIKSLQDFNQFIEDLKQGGAEPVESAQS